MRSDEDSAQQSASADTDKQSKDGSLPFSYSEQHRSECEARWVLKMPLLKRREYLADVERIRKKAGREYLEAELRRQWEKRRLSLAD